jgi:hypothetical protein
MTKYFDSRLARAILPRGRSAVLNFKTLDAIQMRALFAAAGKPMVAIDV